jgi:hypothetical protein
VIRGLPSFRSMRLPAVAAVVLLLGAAVGAWAYFTSHGTGTASASVGTLSAPSIESAAPGAGTVSLKWSNVPAPGSGPVTYYVTRVGGTVGGNCPNSGVPTGVTECTDSGLSAGTYHYTVTAEWRSWTATSATTEVTLASGAATHLAVTASTTTQTAGVGDNLTVTAKDASNNTVTAYTGDKSLTFSGASTIGSNHPTVSDKTGAAVSFGTVETITFASGVATVQTGGKNGVMTLYKAEPASIVVSDGSINNGSGLSVTVKAAGAKSFTVPTPSEQEAGVAFNVTLTAFDQYGNTAKSYGGSGGESKTLVWSGPVNSPNGTAPEYPATVTFTNGVGTATGIKLFNASTTTTLKAKESSIEGTSGTFTVKAAGASTLVFSTQPGSATAGSAFGQQPVVKTQDGFGNNSTVGLGTSRNVTVSIASGIGTLQGTATLDIGTSAGNGTVTFTNLRIDTAGEKTLQATAAAGSPALAKATSNPFTVNAGALDHFTFAAASPQTDGLKFTGTNTLTAQDVFGNTITNFDASTNNVKITAQTPLTGTVSGIHGSNVLNLAGDFSSGVANLSSLGMTYTGNATTGKFLATSATAKTGESGSVVINVGAATKLALSAVTATPTAGEADNLTITALDAGGNTATSYTGEKSLTFAGANNAPNGTHPTATNKSAAAVNFETAEPITFASGVASPTTTGATGQAVMKLYKAGTASITVTDTSINNNASPLAVNVNSAGVPLSYSSPTCPVSQKHNWSQLFTIKVPNDAFNNPFTNVSGIIVNLSFEGAQSGSFNFNGGEAGKPLALTITTGPANNTFTVNESGASKSATLHATASSGFTAPANCGLTGT